MELDIVNLSKELMYNQTKINKAPAWRLTEIAILKGKELAKKYDVDLDMVYTIASYHDLGHYIDRNTHEIISAKYKIKC